LSKYATVFIVTDRLGSSPLQGVLPTVYKIDISRLILMRNRPECLIRKLEEGEGEGGEEEE
jgi:hypothetical protein